MIAKENLSSDILCGHVESILKVVGISSSLYQFPY